MSIKRIAFYLFYDERGTVDDYIIYKLSELKKSVETIFVVSNSFLDYENRKKLESVADIVYCRENIGFDVWAYKDAMEIFGDEKLNQYDELILLNYTFFGPIYPFEEMFLWSENKNIDFWGISDHKEMIPNPFTNEGVLPRHIQSHFIAVSSKMFNSIEFKLYWKNMPMINSYIDSVLNHESKFTEFFSKKGFNFDVYCNSDDYSSNYPTFIDINETLKNRSPILKRRLFFHDPLWLDTNCVDLKQAIDFIKHNSDYDLSLVWNNILRTVESRKLLTNAELHKVFPDIAIGKEVINKKIAVIAHIYYPEMITEIEEKLINIPCGFDLFITTASNESKNIIAKSLSNKNYKNVEIRVVEENRGRDISSLLITCKDIVIDGDYDYICRIHSKKSPQNGKNNADYFKSHMYQNLLNSRGYITNILNFLSNNPNVGMLVPDLVHIGYPTMGHSWFDNKQRASDIAKKLKIDIKFDINTPFAAYGTMFWFKPKAIEKLFMHDWKWSDFESEPYHNDGSLAHSIERLLVYTILDSKHLCYCVSTVDSISKSYVKLEYKYQEIMSRFSNSDIIYQCSHLDFNKNKTNYEIELKNRELIDKDREIELLKLQHYLHVSSKSWKITGPLRKFRRHVMELFKK